MMPLALHDRHVQRCYGDGKACPFFIVDTKNPPYIHGICKANNGETGRGEILWSVTVNPVRVETPAWCPLRDGPITVSLETS